MHEYTHLKMNKVLNENEIHLEIFRKTNVIYPSKLHYNKHLKNKHKAIHFPVYYLQLSLNLLGIYIPFFDKINKYIYLNKLFIMVHYFWELVLIILLLTLVSSCFHSSSFDSIHLCISINLSRGLILSTRVFLVRMKNSYRRLLRAINKLSHLENVKKKKIQILMLFTILSVFGFTLTTVYSLFSSLTFQDKVNRRLENFYYLDMDKTTTDFFVAFVLVAWILTNVSTTSVFTMTYKTLNDIIIQEFLQLSRQIDECVHGKEGKLMVEKYFKAVETGKYIDDVQCFPAFLILGQNLISLFSDGFRLFAENMSSTYQVVIYFILWSQHRFFFQIH